jgi:hypothetical protein
MKFYSEAVANFWGPPNPATTIFMGPHSNFTLAEFVLLGSLQNLNFTPGAFAYFGGPLGPFGFQGPKIKFYSRAFVLLKRLPNSNLTPGLLPILGPTGAFWGSGDQNQI